MHNAFFLLVINSIPSTTYHGKKRPPWMQPLSKGWKTNDFHVFKEGRSHDDIFSGRVKAEWDALPHEDKLQYAATAAHRREVARATDSRLDAYMQDIAEDKVAGPFNISSLKGEFHVHPSAVEKVMEGATMSDIQKQWRAMFPEKVEPASSFPDSLPYDGPFPEPVPDALAGSVTTMLDMMRLALRFCDKSGDAGIMVEYSAAGHAPVYAFIGHSMHLDRNEFEAELLAMAVIGHPTVGGDSKPEPPFHVKYLAEDVAENVQWPCIYSEREFLIKIASIANTVWEMHQLHNHPLGLSYRLVTGRTLVEHTKLKGLDAERLMQQAAMRIFKRAAGQPNVAKKAKGKGKAKAKGKSKASSHAHETKIKKTKVMESEDSTGTDIEVPSESDSESDIPLDAPICKPSGSSASSSGAAVPASSSGAAKYKAKPGENVIEWWANKFPFARTTTGYGVVCGLHTNADGRCAGTPCKKNLTIGESGITEQEARLRLKRWIVVGEIHKGQFDPQCIRQSHVHVGGKHCKDLGSDVCGWSDLSEADLDVIIESM